MRRKPKWWNVDWVELGCRGWDIDVTGAGLGEDGEFDWQYAHLDRETLDLILHGRMAFIAQVLRDLVAAGLLQRAPAMGWLTDNSSTAGNTATGNSYTLRLAS